MQLKQKIIKALVGLIATGFLAVVSVFLFVVYISLDLPKISTLADYRPPLKSQILSQDGHLLMEIGSEKREITSIDDVPDIVINAFLAAEDDNFYDHQGVDYLGVMRAMVKNFKAGRIVQGGSTITQQVAKSLLLTRERSITRKLKDFILAQKIEKKFSKKEILFLYLNQMYFGGGYYGVKAAFRGYFNKELNEATVAESAVIAGLLAAPGRYSPYVNPQFAKKRQLYVLKRLWDTNKITQQEYDSAVAESIRMTLRKRNNLKAGHFSDWVKQRLEVILGEEELKLGGYVVTTTLDWSLQKKAERFAVDGAKEIDKRQGYKGPLRTLEETETVEDHEIEQRKKHFKEASSFFNFNPDGTIEYELGFDEEEYRKIKAFKSASILGKEKQNLTPGFFKEDKLLGLLKKGESYEAVVVSFDKRKRVIHCSVGGVTVLIPYENFRWAHERVIDKDKNLFPYVTDPGQIVAKGHIILVKIEDKSVRAWKHFDSNYTSRYEKDKKLRGWYKGQRYLLGSLDQKPDVQSALIAMTPVSGEIISMVGGNNFFESQFNRAIQSKRQPGSSFKPLLYAAALENGYTPSTVIIDSPEALGGVDSSLNWKPRNYDGKFKGPMTFRKALEISRNVPSIKIASNLGIKRLKDFVDRIDLRAKLDDDLTQALGSFGVTLMDMVKTYAIFPNGGKKVYPKSLVSVVDRDGNPVDVSKFQEWIPSEEIERDKLALIATPSPQPTVEEESEQKPENIFLKELSSIQVYDRRLAYLMTNLLKGVIQNGSGRSAKFVSSVIGGKTGTTNDFVDAWFMGFSSNIVLGVWTGFDDNKSMGWGETGSKAALPIWKMYMSSALKKYGEYDFQAPKGIINVKIDPMSGELASSDSENAFMESFVEGSEPGAEKIFEVENNEEAPMTMLEDDDYFNQE